jgi:pyruvate/2-oxoglutarate/acetoin dehydrogenase E1 component
LIAEHAFNYLDAPIKRVCGRDTPIPFSPILERFVVPQVNDIVEGAREVLSGAGEDL